MILRTLLRHYRRHPIQGLFLLAGIVMANVLLVGTQLINAQARASYAQGELVLGAGPVARIRPVNGAGSIDETLYLQLRRQGFDMLAPMLRSTVLTASGERLELLGVDALAMPQTNRASRTQGTATGFSGFAFAPYELWAAPARITQLGMPEGGQLTLASGERLPPLRVAPGDELGHRVLIDLGALQVLTGRHGQLSELLVFASDEQRLQALQAVLPDSLRYVPSTEAPDPGQLTSSFHLNLAAMGLLAFVVGLFLIYNALAFSYTDRRDLLRKLRLAGVPKAQLARALVFELLLFLLAGLTLGLWLGSQLAAMLLPGVGQTLAQLYGVYITYPDNLVPAGFWQPVAMTALAGLACALLPLRQALDTPLLARWSGGWELATALRRDLALLICGLLLLLAAAVMAWLATSTWQALAGMACLLLGAALCLPMTLRGLLRLLGRLAPTRSASLGWLLADSRWLLSPASLALMAMTLALVANSGLNTMIGSFRQATDDWLAQRLAAELYVTGQVSPARVAQALSPIEPRAELALRHEMMLDLDTPHGHDSRIQVVDLSGHPRFAGSVDLLRGDADAPALFAAGQGVYVSERAWRLDGFKPGQTVELCPAAGAVPVVGVYHDYGNPVSQWMISGPLFQACWPEQSTVGIGVILPPDADPGRIKSELATALGLPPEQVIDQHELRAVGIAVFDRTFGVTRALNLLTLVVAGIGIFCAISAIHHHRTGQQALLASLGMPRRQRGALLLVQWGLLGILCMAMVWPFGTALAAYLAGVVTPAAFGWSFALQVDWTHYLVLAFTAAASLVAAVALPSLRLLNISPASLLREQTV